MKNNLRHKKILILIIFIVIFIVIASAFYANSYYHTHDRGIPIRMDVQATDSSLTIDVFAYRNSSDEFSSLGTVGTYHDLCLVYSHNGKIYKKGFTYNLTNSKESDKIIYNWTVNGSIGPLNGCYKIREGFWDESNRSHAFWNTAPVMINVSKDNIKITGGNNLEYPC